MQSTVIEKIYKLQFSCKIAQQGEALVSIFQHFSASIKKFLSLEGRLMMIAGQTPLAAPYNAQNYLIKSSISHIRAYTPSQVSARFPVQRHHKIVGYLYWIKQLRCVDTPDNFPLFGLLQIVPLGLKTGMTHKNITVKPLIAQKSYSKSGVGCVGPRRVVFARQSSSRSLSRSDLGQTWKMKICF